MSVAAMTMEIVWNRTMGTPMPVPSAFPVRSVVSGSDMRSCRNLGHWKRRFSVTRIPNAALSADRLLYRSPTERNTARTVPPEFTGGRKQKVNGKGGQEWTIRGQGRASRSCQTSCLKHQPIIRFPMKRRYCTHISCEGQTFPEKADGHRFEKHKGTPARALESHHERFANGAHYGAYAPIGYIKDPDRTGHLLVDPETKWIIEKIFSLAVHGAGAKITRLLIEEQVPTPAWLNFQRYGTVAHIFEGADESTDRFIRKSEPCRRPVLFAGNGAGNDFPVLLPTLDP